MAHYRPLLALALNCLLVVNGWPLQYQSPDIDYGNFRLQEEDDGRRAFDETADVEPLLFGDDSALPAGYDDANYLLDSLQQPDNNADQYYHRKLPKINFEDLPADTTNNGGMGPIHFAKPTPTPVTVKTRAAAPTNKPKQLRPKAHVPTINDETPLYLNYADRDERRGHKPQEDATSAAPVAEPSQAQLELDESGVDKAVEMPEESETADMNLIRERLEEIFAQQEFRNQQPASEDERQSAEDQPTEADNEEELISDQPQPELNFAQQITFPDAAESELEQDTNEPADQHADKIQDDTLVTSDPAGDAKSPEPLQVLFKPINQAQNLQVHPEIHLAPTHELEFLEHNLLDKRAQAAAPASTESMTSLTMYIVFACTGAAVFGIVGAAVFYRRQNSKRTHFLDIEEPSYGVTGPPVKPTFLDLSGDRSLAKSAETYHYQHQKRQMLSAGSFDHTATSSSATTSSPKSGDHSDYDSENEEGEEEYGDYTVYECPGLAPRDEMEVVNPMFTTAKKTPSPTQDD